MQIIDFGNGKYGLRKFNLIDFIFSDFPYYQYYSFKINDWVLHKNSSSIQVSLELVLSVYQNFYPKKITVLRSRWVEVGAFESSNYKTLEDLVYPIMNDEEE